MTSTLARLGMQQHAEASRDPRMVLLAPPLIMRPFHLPYLGKQDWHVYCPDHPEFGFCGTEDVAREAAALHASTEHVAACGSSVPKEES